MHLKLEYKHARTIVCLFQLCSSIWNLFIVGWRAFEANGMFNIIRSQSNAENEYKKNSSEYGLLNDERMKRGLNQIVELQMKKLCNFTTILNKEKSIFSLHFGRILRLFCLC